MYNEHCIWTQWHKRILPLCKYWICLSAEKNCDEFLSQIYVIESHSVFNCSNLHHSYLQFLHFIVASFLRCYSLSQLQQL
jgi:hypothetical protein